MENDTSLLLCYNSSKFGQFYPFFCENLVFSPLEVAVTSAPVLALSPETVSAALEGLIAGKLSPLTRKAYRFDAGLFLNWLQVQNLSLIALNRSDLERYQVWLKERYCVNTAARKYVVARRLLEEATERGILLHNPASTVKGFKTEQETPHIALKKEQARQLLSAIDTATLQGKRDYAMVSLLLRTGLRRSECAALTLADLQQEQGHQVAVIRHAKGDKRRKIKIPVDVWRILEEYLNALGFLPEADKAAQPLFVQFRKGDHPQKEAISAQVIQRIVETACEKAGLGVKLTPHGLRATFVTLALEGGAKLEQVQYAVGHADPRTTERYQKRKLNLDNNAVDFVRLD
jgi:site-specific recombinase XerD